jgi:hypothetical protein
MLSKTEKFLFQKYKIFNWEKRDDKDDRRTINNCLELHLESKNLQYKDVFIYTIDTNTKAKNYIYILEDEFENFIDTIYKNKDENINIYEYIVSNNRLVKLHFDLDLTIDLDDNYRDIRKILYLFFSKKYENTFKLKGTTQKQFNKRFKVSRNERLKDGFNKISYHIVYNNVVNISSSVIMGKLINELELFLNEDDDMLNYRNAYFTKKNDGGIEGILDKNVSHIKQNFRCVFSNKYNNINAKLLPYDLDKKKYINKKLKTTDIINYFCNIPAKYLKNKDKSKITEKFSLDNIFKLKEQQTIYTNDNGVDSSIKNKKNIDTITTELYDKNKLIGEDIINEAKKVMKQNFPNAKYECCNHLDKYHSVFKFTDNIDKCILCNKPHTKSTTNFMLNYYPYFNDKIMSFSCHHSITDINKEHTHKEFKIFKDANDDEEIKFEILDCKGVNLSGIPPLHTLPYFHTMIISSQVGTGKNEEVCRVLKNTTQYLKTLPNKTLYHNGKSYSAIVCCANRINLCEKNTEDFNNGLKDRSEEDLIDILDESNIPEEFYLYNKLKKDDWDNVDKNYKERIVICINSICKLLNSNNKISVKKNPPYLLVFDEAMGTLFSLFSSNLGKDEDLNKIWNYFIDLIRHSLYVICLDGFITPPMIKFIKQLRDSKNMVIQKHIGLHDYSNYTMNYIDCDYQKIPTGRTLVSGLQEMKTIDVNKIRFINYIKQTIIKKKINNIIIGCDTRAKAEEMYLYFNNLGYTNPYFNKFKDNIILYTSKTTNEQPHLKEHFKDIKKIWGSMKCKIIIHSPTICQGISFNNKKLGEGFDIQIAFLSNHYEGTDFFSKLQLLFRSRQLVDENIYLYFDFKEDREQNFNYKSMIQKQVEKMKILSRPFTNNDITTLDDDYNEYILEDNLKFTFYTDYLKYKHHYTKIKNIRTDILKYYKNKPNDLNYVGRGMKINNLDETIEIEYSNFEKIKFDDFIKKLKNDEEHTEFLNLINLDLINDEELKILEDIKIKQKNIPTELLNKKLIYNIGQKYSISTKYLKEYYKNLLKINERDDLDDDNKYAIYKELCNFQTDFMELLGNFKDNNDYDDVLYSNYLSYKLYLDEDIETYDELSINNWVKKFSMSNKNKKILMDCVSDNNNINLLLDKIKRNEEEPQKNNDNINVNLAHYNPLVLNKFYNKQKLNIPILNLFLYKLDIDLHINLDNIQISNKKFEYIIKNDLEYLDTEINKIHKYYFKHKLHKIECEKLPLHYELQNKLAQYQNIVGDKLIFEDGFEKFHKFMSIFYDKMLNLSSNCETYFEKTNFESIQKNLQNNKISKKKLENLHREVGIDTLKNNLFATTIIKQITPKLWDKTQLVNNFNKLLNSVGYTCYPIKNEKNKKKIDKYVINYNSNIEMIKKYENKTKFKIK